MMIVECWISMAAFVAVATGLMALFGLLGSGEQRLHARISELKGDAGRPAPPAPPGRQSAPPPAKPPASNLLRLAARVLAENRAGQTRLQQRLAHAGVYSPTAVPWFLGLKLALSIAPPLLALTLAALGWVDLHWGLLVGSMAGCLGMLVPGWWLQGRTARRHRVIRRALPDFLDLIVSCLEGGLSLPAALQRVTDELKIAHPLLCGELTIVQMQTDFGIPLDDALRQFADRAGMEGLHSLASCVQQARRYGSTVADAFRAHAELLRVQREQRAEELAQRAAVKILFPTLLLIFPVLFVVLAGPAAIQLHEKFSKGNDTATTAPK
jgi:tight adherence protein C